MNSDEEEDAKLCVPNLETGGGNKQKGGWETGDKKDNVGLGFNSSGSRNSSKETREYWVEPGRKRSHMSDNSINSAESNTSGERRLN